MRKDRSEREGAMEADEAERRRKRVVSHEIGCDLSALSVDELDERVTLLEAEITRLRDEAARKIASRQAAAAAFRL